MADLSLFLSAIVAHWWAFLLAGPFIVDEALRWLWPSAKRWLDRYLVGQARRKIEIAILITAALWAIFRAWQDEHSAREAAEQRPAMQGPLSPYRWSMLSSAEAVALRDELRDVPPGPIYIICNEDDCGDFARSLRDVFIGLQWKVECCEFALIRTDRGIHLWAIDDRLKAIALKIERSTNGRLKVDYLTGAPLDPAKFSVVIEIGSKP